MSYLLIFIGGGAGSLLRFVISKYFIIHIFNIFFSTILINIIACFLIGVLDSFFSKHIDLDINLRYFLLVGFLGGFSTFSTFSLESFNILDSQGVFYFILYITVSLFGSLLSFYLGNLFAGALIG